MPPDYSGQNLRGHSFKGQNLEGANFSYADIRGTNFTEANLKGANFTGAKAGLQKRWALLLVLVSWLLSAISGYLSLFSTIFMASIFDFSQSIEMQFLGWVALIITIIICMIIIRRGISVNLALAGAFTFAGSLTFVFAGAITGVIALAISVAVAVAVARAFAGAVAVNIAGAFGIVAAFAGAVAVTIAGAFIVAGTVISAYIAWGAMKGDGKYVLVRNVAVAFAAIGGTSFRNADLTDANFTEAQLKSTDLRNAKLIRTCFQKTKLLDRVRPGNSYLQYPQIRQLILTGRGQDKNFDPVLVMTV